jgi:electron transport complex protein RnfC
MKSAETIFTVPQTIPHPQRATLFFSECLENTPPLPKIGDGVKTGQKLLLSESTDAYVISSVTGTVSAVYPYIGDFGRQHTAVVIDGEGDDVWDDQFRSVYENPTLEHAANFLCHAPGNPQLNLFLKAERPIRTIIVYGLDSDVLVATNQYIVTSKPETVHSGIEILKKITGIEHILIVVPRNIVQGYGEIGAEMKAVDEAYPATLPHSIVWDLLGQEIPAGKSFEDMGIAFLSAEGAASIGAAFETGQIPVTKTLTLIKKDGSHALVTARIGTPIGDVLASFGETVNEGDRLVLGGPMRGSCIYSEGYPVQPNTDALFIQDREYIAKVSDYPCINCGECVRVCPAKMPVNMLVRFLEAGQYESAAEEYDLYSCIDCGLCSFVCVSKIPIFQYIQLAKYELGRTESAEASNG